MDFGDELPLNAVVPIEQWAILKRRTRYLEAVIVQILGDRDLVKEWYTAGELAELRLPGLPGTRQGVARLAQAGRWRQQIILDRGREVRVYHCTALPPRAFDAMLDRITMRAAERAAQTPAPAVAPPAGTPAAPLHARASAPPDSATAPPWVLPLLRIIRTQGKLSVAGAVDELRRQLPAGAPCPTYDDAERVLHSLGMVHG